MTFADNWVWQQVARRVCDCWATGSGCGTNESPTTQHARTPTHATTCKQDGPFFTPTRHHAHTSRSPHANTLQYTQPHLHVSAGTPVRPHVHACFCLS
ncbi:hypothetical protein E2C01_096360 [Portunus trituberculatus]|uniref:Uncharacterized protein n=1 Tax=Portunus trituberculatus TaxID=210409 RepID=A0A5B7K1T8_PORTR|nr:hypothetical protein [Portunus trituberculatus]